MSKRIPPLLTEAAMVAALTGSVVGLFGKHANHATEVPAHGRSRTDVCVLAGDLLIAIEAKLTNRRRAIGQAVFNRYYADRSYIAVLDRYVTDDLTNEARQWKLGILAISNSGVAIALPAPLGSPDAELRARVIGSVFA
jgi:hypothetical protein